MNKVLRKGYNFIEVVMIILIIGILAGLSIPRFASFSMIKLSGAVKKTVSDIRYIQQLAISQHQDYYLNFNAITDTYEARRVLDNAYAIDPFTRANMQTNFTTDPQYRGIDITGVNFGGTSSLRFNWKGEPQDANGNPLTNSGWINLSYGGNNITIYISPNTGRINW
ncbi:MAG: hypothetical protein NC912_01490 [Candidatus Omnitrophica bacterium]|nr:hypothetical protein [Candidatus Omnitrophota bacterium]